MKTLAELQAIKAKMQNQVSVRTSTGEIRIVVAMGTCGIAAGARDVLNAFVEAASEKGILDRTIVCQTGCLGKCSCEPVAEVIVKGKENVVYGNLTADRAKEIVEKHVVGGTPVSEYMI